MISRATVLWAFEGVIKLRQRRPLSQSGRFTRRTAAVMLSPARRAGVGRAVAGAGDRGAAVPAVREAECGAAAGGDDARAPGAVAVRGPNPAVLTSRECLAPACTIHPASTAVYTLSIRAFMLCKMASHSPRFEGLEATSTSNSAHTFTNIINVNKLVSLISAIAVASSWSHTVRHCRRSCCTHAERRFGPPLTMACSGVTRRCHSRATADPSALPAGARFCRGHRALATSSRSVSHLSKHHQT